MSGGESDGQTRAGARRREVAVRKGRTDRPASPDHAGRRIGIASARDTGMRKAPSSVLYSWQVRSCGGGGGDRVGFTRGRCAVMWGGGNEVVVAMEYQ